MSNPIIAIAKESWDDGDQHACAAEWLFQLCRLAAEFGVPHEIDYRDPSGPIPLEWSLESGEDSAYWDAVLALCRAEHPRAKFDPESIITQGHMRNWDRFRRALMNHHSVAAHVRVALKTFDRIHRMTDKED